MIRKGSNVGRTVSNHKSTPELAPFNAASGKRSIEAKKRMGKRMVRNRFIESPLWFLLK